MPGLRILNIHPRLAGPVARWGELFELAAATGFNTVWLNPFHRTTEVVFERRGKQWRRSLYAIADHGALDVSLSSGDAARDLSTMGEAIAHARRLGLRVMVDLVLNHVAVDHPLVLEENAAVRAALARPGARVMRSHGGEPQGIQNVDGDGAIVASMSFVFNRNERLEVTDFQGTTGFDNAQIDFASPVARRLFMGATPGAIGLWKQQLDLYLGLGITAFRCDMAHNVPASWWSELISYARAKEPDVVFLAETLGGREKNLQLASARVPIDSQATPTGWSYGGRPAFELVTLSIPWWDMKDEWIFEEIALAHHIAHYGGAGTPDTHDQEETLAQKHLRELRQARRAEVGEVSAADEREIQRVVAALCVRSYAVAALAGSSVIATLSYLFCLDQSTVFWDPELMGRLETDLRERSDLSHPLNLRSRITEVNEFLRLLPLDQVKAELDGMPRIVSCHEDDERADDADDADDAEGCDSGCDVLSPDATAAPVPGDSRECVFFEVLLRHAATRRPIGRIAVAVDRSYEAHGPRLDKMLEAIAVGPAPGLRAAVMRSCVKPEDELPAKVANTLEPVWLETPLLVACFRPQPAESTRRSRQVSSHHSSSGAQDVFFVARRSSGSRLARKSSPAYFAQQQSKA